MNSAKSKLKSKEKDKEISDSLNARFLREALKEGELSYRNLFNTIEDSIFIQDEEGKFVDVNIGATKMYGYLREELLGKSLDFLSVADKNDLSVINDYFICALGGKPQTFEFCTQNKSGVKFVQDVKLYKGVYFGKDVLIVHARDITKRKQAEQKMQTALAEKNILLREVHHRVKNNLQAMIYLIEMQIDRLEDVKVQTFLRELQEQARTMSLVYEQLYQSDYLAEVDMDGYLNNLVTNVIQTFGAGRDINFKVDAENVLLDVETAMPVGLIINEILTNSLKYAFPENFSEPPFIFITVKRINKMMEIILSDNGIGIPQNFDWENTETLGLKLVNFWIKYQLAGKIQLDRNSGTKFLINFGYEGK
jgi:PAS domain S-box-containing protein